MAYATYSNVQALIPEFTIGASSKPSQAEVTTMIAQIEGLINGILISRGYGDVPATGTSDVAMLQGVVSCKVAARTLLAAHSGDTAPEKVDRWLADYDAFLARLTSGEQYLIDQSPRVTTGVFLTQRWTGY